MDNTPKEMLPRKRHNLSMRSFLILLLPITFVCLEQKPAKAACSDSYSIGWFTNKSTGKKSKQFEGDYKNCAWGNNSRWIFTSDAFSVRAWSTDKGMRISINNEKPTGGITQRTGQTACVQQDESQIEYCWKSLKSHWKNRSERNTR